MKKIILTTCIVFISISLQAQIWGNKRIKGNGNIITETRKTAHYDAISVGGNFKVTLTKGTEGTITITADENILPYIITEEQGGTLKIKYKRNTNVRGSKQIKITVPYTTISAISLGGSGIIISKDIVKTSDLSVNIGGSGSVILKVDANKISTSIGGSGKIKLAGKTNQLQCSLAGSGSVKAYELTTDEIKVNLAGSGGVRITVKNKIDATIVGSGSVYYKGNPKHIKSKSVGSGDVRERN